MYISFPSWVYLSSRYSHAGFIGIPIVYISFPSWDYLSSHCVYFIPMLGLLKFPLHIIIPMLGLLEFPLFKNQVPTVYLFIPILVITTIKCSYKYK